MLYPDLTNQIIGVSVKFCHVLVTESHKNVFWPFFGKKMATRIHHLNFATWTSLFLQTINTTLQQLRFVKSAAENETKHGKDVAETLINNFYVNDMLESV